MRTATRKKIAISIKIMLSAGLILWLCSGFAWRDLFRLMGGMDPLWLGGAGLWIVLSIAVSAWKWVLVFRAMQIRVPVSFLWRCYWAGLFCNNFLPSSIGGDALRIYLSGRYADDMPAGTASVVVERLLATLGLALTALVFFPFVPVHLPYLGWFFSAVALLSGFLILLIFSPTLLDWLSRICQPWDRPSQFLASFRGHGQRLAGSRFLLSQVVAWSVIFQLCVVMVNYCLFQALDLRQVNFAQAAVLIPATSVAAMLPIGINGYGTREGAYIALFATLGVGRAAAMAASIVFALLVTAASLYGGWLLLRGKILKGGWRIGETHFGQGSPVFFSRQ